MKGGSPVSARTMLVFVSGVVVGLGVAYRFAIKPLTLGAELSAQSGFMLLRDRRE